MEQLVAASLKAIGSVFAPGMLGVFIKSLLLSLLVLVGFVVLVTSIAAGVAPMFAQTYPQWSEWLPYLTGAGAMLFAFFLFPGIMPIIVNFFDNRIATNIERQDYPAARPIDPPFWPEFWHDVRFSLLAITLNILVLPLYLVPFVNIFVFYVLNGHLLGKEFFVMVARRHRTLSNAKALYNAHSRTVFAGGVILTIIATIPLVNLFAPFWGIAMMTHFYHAITQTNKMDILTADNKL